MWIKEAPIIRALKHGFKSFDSLLMLTHTAQDHGQVHVQPA